MGPTVEVMSHGEAGEHPGAEVLKAQYVYDVTDCVVHILSEAETGTSWPMVVQHGFTVCPMLVQPLSGLTLGGLTTTRSTCRCT